MQQNFPNNIPTISIQRTFIFSISQNIFTQTSMRTRATRAKSAIPRQCTQQRYFLLWLNQQYRSIHKNIGEELQNNNEKFRCLQEVWNSGFIRRILQGISMEYFGENFWPKLEIAEFDEFSYGDSSKSIKQHKKFQIILDQIQNYLRATTGKSVSHYCPVYLINLHKIVSLVLFLSIESSNKEQTARIILSLPPQAQQFLHSIIHQISNSLQTIKQYKQILTVMQHLQTQNNNLNNQLHQLCSTLEQQKQLLTLTSQDHQKLREYCTKLQSKFEKICEKYGVADFEDLDFFVGKLIQDYERQLGYSERLVEEKGELEKELMLLNGDLINRNSIILELSQKFQGLPLINRSYSDGFRCSTSQLLPLNSAIRSRIIQQQPQHQNFPIPIFSVTHSKQISNISTKPSNQFQQRELSMCSTDSNFNKQATGISFSSNQGRHSNMFESNGSYLPIQQVNRLKQNPSCQLDRDRKWKQCNATLRHGLQIVDENIGINSLMGKQTLRYPKKNKQNTFAQTFRSSTTKSPFDKSPLTKQLESKNEQLIFQNLNLQNDIEKLQTKHHRHHHKIQKIMELHRKFCEDMGLEIDVFGDNREGY